MVTIPEDDGAYINYARYRHLIRVCETRITGGVVA